MAPSLNSELVSWPAQHSILSYRVLTRPEMCWEQGVRSTRCAQRFITANLIRPAQECCTCLSLYLQDTVQSGGAGHVTNRTFDGSPALTKGQPCPFPMTLVRRPADGHSIGQTVNLLERQETFDSKHAGQCVTSRADFLAAAQHHNLVPVYTRLTSDQLTPVTAYRCLVAATDFESPSFLFESVQNGTDSGRFSFVGAHPALELLAKGNEVIILDHEMVSRHPSGALNVFLAA